MDDFLSEFSNILINLNNKEDIKKILQEIHTENEIADLRLRWELLKMLKNGHSQRSIARDLKISLCKITRGAKILKDENGVIKRVLDNPEDYL